MTFAERDRKRIAGLRFEIRAARTRLGAALRSMEYEVALGCQIEIAQVRVLLAAKIAIGALPSIARALLRFALANPLRSLSLDGVNCSNCLTPAIGVTHRDQRNADLLEFIRE